MIKESARMRISVDNTHLLDIFTDYHYLELGNIDYKMWTRLLKHKTIRIDDLVDFRIQNKGIGSSNVNNEFIRNYLPYINFLNINKKNQTLQLFITYGLVKIKNGKHKDIFAPLILIPVNLYFENNTIYIKLLSRPLENIVLLKHLKQQKIEIPSEKLESVQHFDKYCLHFQKQNLELRVENYLTYAKTVEPPIIIKHERYSLANKFSKPLESRYYRDDESEIINITLLNYRQRMAVQKANSGNSFAISGPLGTGKTTTLINIASDALAHDKKILYVSNMKETLDFVEEVFASRGLRFFVDNLTNTSKYNLNNDDDYVCLSDEEINIKKELLESYQKLENYEKFLSGRIRNFRFLDVLKSLINFDVPDVDSDIDDLDHLYKFEYDEIISCLYRIEEAMKKIKFKDSKFTNIPIDNNIKYPNQVITLVFQIHKNFTELKLRKDILENEHLFKEIPNYAKFKNVIGNIKNFNKDLLPEVWIKSNLLKYYEARNTLGELKSLIYALQEYELYLEWDFENYENFNIEKAISNILGEYFTENNIEQINKVIDDQFEIINKVRIANQNYKALVKNADKIKTILNWPFTLEEDEALNEVIRLIDFLNSGIYHRKWLIKSQHAKTRADLVKIQDKLNHFIYLEKSYAKYFNNPNEIDSNIELLEKLNNSNKSNKKFKNVDMVALLKDIKEYKELKGSANRYNKMHINLTGFEYSPVFNSVAAFDKFINYLDGFKNFEYETYITKFLLSVDDHDLDTYALEFHNFRRAYQLVENSFQQIASYFKVDTSVTFVQKGEFLSKVYKYLALVRDTNIEMQALVKNSPKFIHFETYLKLKERMQKLRELNSNLVDNPRYIELYGHFFNNEKTNINEISNLIKSFDLYIDCFVDVKAVVNSIDKFANIKAILGEAIEFISEINDSFKSYTKIFKDGVGTYYYDDFASVIGHFDDLLHAKDELINYLEITNNLKVLTKYRLYNLMDYIVDKNTTQIVPSFKYHFYQCLYHLYCRDNKHDEVKPLLENIIKLEKSLIDLHIASLQDLKGRSQEKMLVLATTPILNYYLDYRDFDLILIDDAHLLEANEYYNAINGEQVIIAGEDSKPTNLISRMRENSIMKLNFRYTLTPLHLLSLIPNVKGAFRSKVSESFGVDIIYRDASKYLANLIINNSNVLINYFTSKLETKVTLTEEISQILLDNNIEPDLIFTIITKRLNIVDLFSDYVYDADYNILDLKDYYHKEYDQLTLKNLMGLVTCKKQLIIIDTENIIRQENNNQFMMALDSILKPSSMFNAEIQEVLYKLASELSKFGIIVHGTLFDLNLVLERNNTFYGVLLFANPDNAHINLIEDYRDYYEVCKKNNMKVLIVNIIDLVSEFNEVIEYINRETAS